MKKILLSVVIPALVISTSCRTTRAKSSTVKSTDITVDGVFARAVIADLDVKETKVTATATGNATKGENLDYVKKQALATAVKNANADVLVEPTFDIEVINNVEIRVTTTGYPASYKNFRTVTEADSGYLKQRLYMNTLSPASMEKSEVPLIPSKPKKKWWLAPVIVAGSALVVLVAAIVASEE